MKLQQVDLNLLVVLDALLREGNVTRAAERLHMSQSATSTALARLRKVLGDELLVKNGRHLRFTPRAESLINPVRDVLAAIDQSIVCPPGFDPDNDHRVFTIYVSDYVEVTLVRSLLGRLAGLNTGLRIDVAPVPARYVSALRRDEADLAVLPDRLVDTADLDDCVRVQVISDRVVGAVWSGHPAAGGRLDADVLSSFPYLQYQTAGGRGLVEDDLDEAGISRRVEAVASSFVGMLFMLAGTHLVALTQERLARRVAQAADIVLLEPDFPLAPLHQSVFWRNRRGRDSGHAWLREQLLAVAADTAGPGAVAAEPSHR
ncbi:LysR family transcriptional regulator [Pseudofrankia asymbiotica]|uniref:HTH lysR-type domain-containing protein n=1 Tax=Pseudofrankia asymbiotica TaxID=1834516 RepID=A0A1V2I1J7_9ACTN|nr:LysR family transcriptional regulator [Pseudofrankia asymbiotica]ONH23625.1 hypothetical protein BL253_32545 [Pseudofrankia asymbiotica]